MYFVKRLNIHDDKNQFEDKNKKMYFFLEIKLKIILLKDFCV